MSCFELIAAMFGAGCSGAAVLIWMAATHDAPPPPPVRIDDRSTWRRPRHEGALGHVIGAPLCFAAIAYALTNPIC